MIEGTGQAFTLGISIGLASLWTVLGATLFAVASLVVSVGGVLIN